MKMQGILKDLFDPGTNLYLINPIIAFILGTVAVEMGNDMLNGLFLTVFTLTMLPVPRARRKRKEQGEAGEDQEDSLNIEGEIIDAEAEAIDTEDWLPDGENGDDAEFDPWDEENREADASNGEA